jgi:DNA-directed RNA polymerase alpha subunit
MRIFSVMLLALFLVACQQEETKALLQGDWMGVSWKVNGEESGRVEAGVQFHFDAEDTYTATYGDQVEKGSYRVRSGKLYTVAENKIEKMVGIARLTPDTLIMDMNRVGTAEELVLVRKK